ncbi:ATP-binding protein [Acidianus manzaensis]|uniref:Helicase HerA central domain-containing protein n=1 Tax=Acidianus manzaensis TaxID=282676 RepID=A0A1W6K340_9CREN|nr:ATP-binding protein [Acidianus manzaensis]ARM76917.1 hypothetical protein B6F84_13415 [Acidianus manzaensis]
METNTDSEDKIINDLSKKLDEAESEAKTWGKIIGRITRYETVRIGEEELIGVDIAFEDYLNSEITKGQYLAIRGITRPVIMIGQVYSITRADVLSRLGIRELTYPKDPTTIITTTYIELQPIAELEKKIEGGDKIQEIIRPAVSPIDPQSPVFIPKAKLLEKILRIPKQGITIGRIFSGGEEIEAKVRLDEETLKHHTLILGTTGSGKTTLLKNVIISEEIPKQTLVFDRQRDFVNFMIDKKKEFAVVMPVSEKPNPKVSIQDFVQDFANWYECTVTSIKVNGGFVDCKGTQVFVIPYSINFFDNFKTFNRITPYFTSKASMYWEGIVNKTFEILGAELHEFTQTYVGEDDLALFLRDRLRPGDLISSNKISISYPVKITKFMSKSHVSYDSKSNSLGINLGKAFLDSMDSLSLAPSTKEAIIRTLKAYDSYGIFTVPGTVDFDPSDVFSLYDNVIVDLSWVMEASTSVEAVASIAYKILDQIFAWKNELYVRKQKSPLTLIIMDEAHEYFPQTNQETVSKDIVEGLINRIMRLGRVRNIGVILATHVPDDLNPLVLQLSNTKIVMRNDTHVLKSIGMEKFDDFLRHAIPGLGIVDSIDFSEIPIKTVLPY